MFSLLARFFLARYINARNDWLLVGEPCPTELCAIPKYQTGGEYTGRQMAPKATDTSTTDATALQDNVQFSLPANAQLLATWAAEFGGVGVSMHWLPDQRVLRTTFAPDQQQGPTHLYDTNLPIDGLVGVGRPTCVEIVTEHGFIRPATHRVLQTLLNPTEELAYYPAGRVMIDIDQTCDLTLGYAGSNGIRFALTYMASFAETF